MLFLVLALLIAGCTQFPTGEVVEEPEIPFGVEDIVKATLPVKPKVEETSKYLAKITVNEGELISLDLDASDPDGDPLTYTFGEPLDENGQWQTKIGDRGEYPVEVMVSDGMLESTNQVLIIVEGINMPPELLPPEQEIQVVEGQSVILDLTARDPDGDDLTWTFGAPFDQSGTWDTKVGDRGTYQASVSVSDGEFIDRVSVTIIVVPANRPPILKVTREITVMEGETVVIEPEVSDPDGDDVEVVYSGWMDSSTKETGFDDAGEWRVTVIATDGIATESQVVRVIVENVNRAPEIKGIIVK